MTNATLIGTGVFTESLVRWIDRDFPRSPFTVLDTSLQNEELESTIALLFSMQKPKSFELLRKSFLWNSHCVEPLLNDKNMTLHEMRVALTGTKKKTEKCLAKPKLLRRIPAENAVPPTTLNDSSSGNEGTSYGARNRRPSNTAGPSSAEGSDRGDSPFRPPMTSTMATPDEGTNEDST